MPNAPRAIGAGHFLPGSQGKLLLGKGEILFQGPHRLQLLRGHILQHGRAMAGNDGRQIEFAFELPAGRDEVLGLFHGRQGGAQGLAVDRRVSLVVQSLGDQAQCGGELGPSGKVGPAIGQFESMADLLVGLRGNLFHRFRTHGAGSRAAGRESARWRGSAARPPAGREARNWRRVSCCAGRLGLRICRGDRLRWPAGTIPAPPRPTAVSQSVSRAVDHGRRDGRGDRRLGDAAVPLAAGNWGMYLGHPGLTRSHEGESASVA